jgi:hypothetical protein
MRWMGVIYGRGMRIESSLIHVYAPEQFSIKLFDIINSSRFSAGGSQNKNIQY